MPDDKYQELEERLKRLEQENRALKQKEEERDKVVLAKRNIFGTLFGLAGFGTVAYLCYYHNALERAGEYFNGLANEWAGDSKLLQYGIFGAGMMLSVLLPIGIPSAIGHAIDKAVFGTKLKEKSLLEKFLDRLE